MKENEPHHVDPFSCVSLMEPALTGSRHSGHFDMAERSNQHSDGDGQLQIRDRRKGDTAKSDVTKS